MSLEILNLSLEKNLQTQKNMRAKVFFDTKNTLCTHILLPKKLLHAYSKEFFSEFGQTQELSLENSANSSAEFVEFSKLRIKRKNSQIFF